MATLTIGLLECDHVRQELQHINGDYRQMFPTLFSKVSSEIEFKFYDVVNGHFPESPEVCDGYLSTGSSFSVYDDVKWIHNLADFVRSLYRSGIPYVGICFGHQMIGHALGGLVQKAPVGWCVGVHKFSIMLETDWMNPLKSSVNLLMMCQDQVVTLPPDTKTLATTPDCPNAMIITGKTMLGIQAHPEFTIEYDKALMELRIEKIGEEKVSGGISSLTQTIHQTVVAGWIMNFFINLQERK